MVITLSLSTPNCYTNSIEEHTVPEKILNTIVSVNGSSGVVVHSSETYSLVLTAYHTILELIDANGDPIEDAESLGVGYIYLIEISDNVYKVTTNFKVLSVHVDKKRDIALIEIKTDQKIAYAELAINNPKIADEVFLAGNPNYNYRSISVGHISSQKRFKDGSWVWQIAGGTTFGFSGGGAFTTDGKLFAIAISVDYYNTGFCGTDEEEELVCFQNPIYHIGFFIPPDEIKKFLFSTKFKNNFKHLKRGKNE